MSTRERHRIVCTTVAAAMAGAAAVALRSGAPTASPEPHTTPGDSTFLHRRSPYSQSALVEQGSVHEALPRSAPRETGTAAWRPRSRGAAGAIEGYTGRPSGVAGRPVPLRVSTTDATFRVVAYRLGAYRGGPAHEVWRSGRVRARHQPTGPAMHARTRTVAAAWRPSLRVDTHGWREGFYVFHLVAARGAQSAVPYVVRSSSTAGKVALVLPSATWQAYNTWGGYSLYDAPPGDRRAWAVSFDRPFADGAVGEVAFSVLPTVVTAERAGVPLAYLSDLDLDDDPRLLLGATAYVSVGHDEYWSASMLEAVRRARDRGTNLLFLGANTAYWKVRVERSRTGAPVVVAYKSDAALDPLRRTDPRNATGLLRDDRRHGPEQRLTGTSYECFPVDAPFRVVSPRWWGFAGTGVRDGTEFAHLVGVEADRAYPDRHLPRPLQVLAHTPYSCLGVPTTAQAVYYTTRSGAGVLNVGTLRWTCSLVRQCGDYRPDRRTARFTRRVTTTVLRTFATGPAGRDHPARDNVDRFDLPLANLVPAS